MNRTNRRRLAREKRQPYRPELTLLNIGASLFLKATGRSLDTVKLVSDGVTVGVIRNRLESLGVSSKKGKQVIEKIISGERRQGN